VRASVDSRMGRVRRIQSQVAEAFKLKMRARGLWVNDQNAVIDAANNKIVMGAQFRARVDALLREAASALNSSVVAGLNAGDRDLQIGRLKMSNGQELVDLLGSMITTLFNQVRASGSYSGTERDVTDWETLLA
ncbi:MAG: hypothetical protein U1C73_05430, partial [Dietzia sp.]|nr:hypothetical protein [Dietzia sp.]